MISITFSPYDLKPRTRELIMSLLAIDLAERQSQRAQGLHLSTLEIAEIVVLGRQLEEYNKSKGKV